MTSNRMWVALMVSGLALSGAGLAGCQEEETPGTQLDAAIDGAGEQMEGAGEAMEDAATQAGEAGEEAAGNVGDAME